MKNTHADIKTLKVIACSGLLMFVPLSVFLHNLVDNNASYFFPFLGWGEMYYDVYIKPSDPVKKNLQWVISLGSDRLCAIIYIICAALRPDFSKCFTFNLWYLYGAFEFCRLVDHFLTYEQTPFREFFGYFLIIFQLGYASMYVTKTNYFVCLVLIILFLMSFLCFARAICFI